jgi:hypothetical protein
MHFSLRERGPIGICITFLSCAQNIAESPAELSVASGQRQKELVFLTIKAAEHYFSLFDRENRYTNDGAQRP